MPESTPTDGVAAHWQRAYAARRAEELSWAEKLPALSLELIAEAALPLNAAIVDVGGGASKLSGELLRLGYGDITVADISDEGLERARSDLGAVAARVAWVEADVRDHDFGRRFDLWHDRAVLHFMVDEPDRAGYLRTLDRALKPGGDLILATFDPQGPAECSGLPVRRYDARQLADLLGPSFEPLTSRLHAHHTPSGAVQQFVYARFKRRGPR